jgi:hypothetical protein
MLCIWALFRAAKTAQLDTLRNKSAQTLPDATPPIGKINHFSKIAVNFEPLVGF